MKSIVYILFLLPTLFSCQNKKNFNKYSLFVEGVHTYKNFENCKPASNFQYKNTPIVTYFETGKYDKALENFEKQSKVYDFAENIYFKSKVSKIRNKDYLDLKSLALKSYDEGKTMKDA